MAWRQWTRDDDKRFEEALVRYAETCQYRFESIAASLGMPLQDVMYYYDALLHDVGLIESGEYATTNYPDSSGGISSLTKHNDKDRKRGKPWTEDEHRCFLELLARFGKGDWKNIARYMKSRTPTQVASHAQKYFLRQIMENRTKKRSSIHDITPVDHAAER